MSSIPRFFVPPDAIVAGEVLLPSEASHHARSVLRLRLGEKIRIHNGENRAFLGELIAVESIVRATILEEIPLESEPQTRITIAQALPKTGEKVEQVLQHGTEIGAAGFLFFEAERSVTKLEPDRREKRLERWRGIIQSAAEQSGRGIIPTVDWAGRGKTLVGLFAGFDAVVVLHEAAVLPLYRHLPTGDTLLLLVGPEGGFSENEVALFTKAGAVSLSLGPRVLRTETAALVALAQVLLLRE